MSNPKTSRIAGAATPSDPKADIQEARKISQRQSSTNVWSSTILDKRRDELIAIADLTGATLDDVVRTVGLLPDTTFAATVDVLAALAAPSDLQDLVQQHQAAADRMEEVETDDGIAEIAAQIDAIERLIMATPARTPAEAYAKIMAIFPDLRFDLQRPEYEPLGAEIGGV